MALVALTSPRIVVFGVFNSSTGAPVTGAGGTFSFELYADDQGTPISPPAISEIGNGLYKFTPTFSASGSRGLVYVLSTGGGSNTPRRYYEYIRPETFDEDKVKAILQAATGRWKIHTTGPNVNQLVMYDNDGTTILFKFNMLNVSGSPTTVNPYEAQPV